MERGQRLSVIQQERRAISEQHTNELLSRYWGSKRTWRGRLGWRLNVGSSRRGSKVPSGARFAPGLQMQVCKS